MKIMLLLSFINLIYTTNDAIVNYNRAVKSYTNSNYYTAQEYFLKAIPSLSSSNIKANAYFYIGNIYFKNKEYMLSIDYYKNALRKNSKFQEAKHNLALARIMQADKNKQDITSQHIIEIDNIMKQIDEIEAKNIEKLPQKEQVKNQREKNNW